MHLPILDPQIPHGNGRAAVAVPLADYFEPHSVGVWHKGQYPSFSARVFLPVQDSPNGIACERLAVGSCMPLGIQLDSNLEVVHWTVLP